jgi:hypothetical protein
MSEEPVTACVAPTPVAPANSAIARCTSAYQQARKASLAKNKGRYATNEAAAEAYKRALPPLLGPENIIDFIACVARGALLGVIDDRLASRLLAAARTAQSCLRAHADAPSAAPENNSAASPVTLS